MCEDGKSEATAEAGATSSRVHPPSTSGRSGRSSRLPTPESLLQDPDGRRVARTFLADSLIDMRLPPRASPSSPRPRKKRGIDQVVSGSLPPSPDKMFLELDEQHEEAKRARRTTPVAHRDSKPEEVVVEGQDSKRQRRLPIRGSNPTPEAAPTSAAQTTDSGGNGTSSRRPYQSSSSPEQQKG
ncbi:hypothetical protein CGCSCA4_v000314 [Colletotrichum siamense]|uniref:Uncharacterized protein n=1 Tax=Colletotrichum siamense TaxID=690259 RepID=A0A9P5EXE1_COLSI|nr:hypothetical protein CGCSCA4_v000314 [Colletotrichum siamense]KAF4862191.1 hypothetical protein CGCSCA2_v004132 [Colletotrichum siamense]